MAPSQVIAIEPAVLLDKITRFEKDREGHLIKENNGHFREVDNKTPLKVDTAPCTIIARFKAALDHRNSKDSGFENLNIVLAATFVFGDVKQSQIKTKEQLLYHLKKETKRVTVFLCGGPGDWNPSDRNETFNQKYLRDNGCLIFLNYRGTGYFSEIGYKVKSSNESDDKKLSTVKRYVNLVKSERSDRDLALANGELNDKDANNMANLLTLFRQDSIVYDLESIRQCIGKDKWHIFGQSYGGWISLTYLSLFPESLESSTITAGLAPIMSSCDVTYIQLFEKVKSRNDRYYGKHPEDINKVKSIVKALLEYEAANEEGLKISDGRLTARRFLCIGRNLGARKSFPNLHKLIAALHQAAISKFDLKSKQVQDALKLYEEEDSWKFERRPLYAVLHEAMYSRGAATNWSAQRMASEFPEFEWAATDEKKQSSILTKICEKDDGHKIYFSGEMVYRFMFEDYDALKPLKAVANNLAQHEWTDPYNNDSLKINTVPVTAVSYDSDMHVHRKLSEATAAPIARIRHKVLFNVPGTEDEFQHASLRTDTVAVFEALNTLRNDLK